MKTAFILLLSVTGLSGCGLIQQHQMQQNQMMQQARVDQAKQDLKAVNERCVATLRSDPRLDPLRSHITFGADSTAQQLASTKKPTAKEKQAILAFDEDVSNCFSEREAVLKNADAPYYMIQNTREYAAAAKQAKAELWAGNYTYGKYLKVAAQNFQNAENSRVAAAQADQDRQQQMQMRQANINASNAQAQAAIISAQAQQQSANAQTMMMFNQAQRQQRQQFNAPGSPVNPIQTNCTNMGGSVNCQTYSY